MRLAAQHETGGHLGLVEREIALHAHLAFNQLGTAGAADARGAGERHFHAGGGRGIEDAGHLLAKLDLAAQAVADDHDAGLLGVTRLAFVHHRVGALRGPRTGLRRHAEALDVHPVFGHAGGQQRGLGLFVHLERAADVGVCNAGRRHHLRQEITQLVAVHQAHVQRGIRRFVAEDMVQHQPGEVPVLQVFELFLEHRRLQAAVAVDQREARMRLARQHCLHDRQDRRDAAAAGDADVVAVRGGVQRHEEAALRCHHLHRVAGFQVGIYPVAEDPALDLAHAHAQLAIVDAGTDRIRAAQVLAVDVGAQREVLALGKTKGGTQVGRHVEADDHRFGSVGFDGADFQRVEQRIAHRGTRLVIDGGRAQEVIPFQWTPRDQVCRTAGVAPWGAAADRGHIGGGGVISV